MNHCNCPNCQTVNCPAALDEAHHGHAGDCTIYASLINGTPLDGICTCGYGWRCVRRSDWDNMFSVEWLKANKTASGSVEWSTEIRTYETMTDRKEFQVFLKVGVQSFGIGPILDDLKEAGWWRDRVIHAMQQIQPNAKGDAPL